MSKPQKEEFESAYYELLSGGAVRWFHVASPYEDRKCLRTATEPDNYAIIVKSRLLKCRVEIQRPTRRKLAALDLIGCLD